MGKRGETKLPLKAIIELILVLLLIYVIYELVIKRVGGILK